VPVATAHPLWPSLRPSPPPPPRAAQLLRSGRTVVAAVRSADKAAGVFSELGLKAGPEAAGPGTGGLVLAGGVDVTDAATLAPSLFQGVGQVGRDCRRGGGAWGGPGGPAGLICEAQLGCAVRRVRAPQAAGLPAWAACCS
jgi:hypothetical protein